MVCAAAPTPPPAAVFTKYCTVCHNAKLKTGGFVLDISELQHPGAHAEVWEKVVQKLRTESMPPAPMPRPDEATYNSTATWLETALDRASAEHVQIGKLPLLHRLSRTEYENAIRDLLAVDALPKEMDYSLLLPPDNASSGFDNIADLLFVSPTAMESYLEAARKISRLAVGDPSTPVMVNTYRLSGEHTQDVHVQGLPFGTRGGLGVRTDIPLDGDYVFKIEFARPPREPDQLEITVDGAQAQLVAVGENPQPGGFRGFRRAAKPLEIHVPLKAGPRMIGVTFVQKDEARDEDTVRPRMRGRGTELAIEMVTISGPYNGQTRRGHAQPAADFCVPPIFRKSGGRDRLRPADSFHAGTAGLSQARDGRGSPGRDAVLYRRTQGRKFRPRHRAGCGTLAGESAISVPH